MKRKTMYILCIIAVVILTGTIIILLPDKIHYEAVIADEKTDLFPVTVNGLCGYIDNKGRMAIKPQFDVAKDFSEGIAFVKLEKDAGKKDAPFYAIDKKGNILFKTPYYYGHEFHYGVANVASEYHDEHFLYGLINKEGKIVSELKYSVDFRFTEDGLAANNDTTTGKSGYVDNTGKVAIDFKYDRTDGFYNGLAVVGDKGELKVIDKKGNELRTLKKGISYSTFNEGLAAISEDNKTGLIDINGNVIIEPSKDFDVIMPFSDGIAAFKTTHDGKFGFIDKQGKIVIEPKFNNENGFSDGTCIVKVNEKFGIIDKTGKYIINPEFDEIHSFSEGMALVSTEKGCGYINREGKVVIEPKFDDADCFRNGLAWVKIGDKTGYIDKTGKYVWKPTK